jgi:methyltransferase (TIGR00027 family)
MAASKTALLVCALRGRATERADAVCSDPWALALAGADGLRFAADFERAYPHAELFIALRTAFLDDQVVRFTERHGVEQVVILGAGFDTRAARLARRGVRFFEVDQADSQAEKKARIARLDGYPSDAATFVECDFEREDFLERLTLAGFSTERPALFLWEGVTYYLTESAVRSTLARIAGGSHPRSVVVFDLVRTKMVSGELRDEGDRAAREELAGAGEPLRFGSNDILPLLYEAGFRCVESVSFDELCLHYTETYERARKFRFQSIAVASRATPLLSGPA